MGAFYVNKGDRDHVAATQLGSLAGCHTCLLTLGLG